MKTANKTEVINTNSRIRTSSSWTTIINQIYGRSTASAKADRHEKKLKIIKNSSRSYNKETYTWASRGKIHRNKTGWDTVLLR
jgi:hypothetical protein